MPIRPFTPKQSQALLVAIRTATDPSGSTPVAFVYPETAKEKLKQLLDKLPLTVTLFPIPTRDDIDAVNRTLRKLDKLHNQPGSQVFILASSKANSLLYANRNQVIQQMVIDTIRQLASQPPAAAEAAAAEAQPVEPETAPTPAETTIKQFEELYQGKRDDSTKIYVLASVLPAAAFNALAPNLLKSAAYREQPTAQAQLAYLKQHARDRPNSRTAQVLNQISLLNNSDSNATTAARASARSNS